MVSTVRDNLVAAGVRLLEGGGVSALSARSVATEAGTSTMALYTHFGGMTGLLDAVAVDVFARFTEALTEVAPTDDPVADFLMMGLAYHRFALANPQRYQLIFGAAAPASISRFRADITETGSATNRAEWAASFGALHGAVHRMMAAGRIRRDDELAVAGRLWSINHGAVMLEMAGFFGHEGHGLVHILGPLIIDTLVGMGDDRDAATLSMQTVVARLG
ncbi:TetR/AcrR family transcriptional regulator [Mycolicibacterium sp. PAM1]|uniref:Transcriptional regulator, TetR family n=1 Tax=Mycolicibacterium gilvum (strain PYR-GCK) TaxID=350054 RepID=A4T962_MYCGI|nr:TetR/AcrR family transcriptional regulator [Mycolicibacterium sp. PAM1]ABP44588.1 transcriptional regulator, TetR family [Mycolicibacterium gilvum PYR-GCK]MBV5245966.1 TetR/AcrR family transcriptional regulator [Mycolicibacterium sp. PAM1]